MTGETVLAIENVTKTFPLGFLPRRRTVISDLSLTVGRGEIVGFLGPNGAGKTTTLKLIVSLLSPDRGVIRIDGRDARLPEARARLGYLPENPYFYDYLTGTEFLDFYGRLYGLDRGLRRERAGRLLERLGLSAVGDVPLRRYSKGMLQRLGVAQTLLAEPTLLILDEPMSGLDPVGRRQIRDLILEVREQGATVFFSSHILQDVEMICDRVAILADGRLKSVGDPAPHRAVAVGYELEYVGEPPEPSPASQVLACAGGRYLVRVKTLEDAERLMVAVRDRGGRVLSLVGSRSTLEDYFLEQIGGAGPAQECRS